MAQITIKKELEGFLKQEGVYESFLDNVAFDAKCNQEEKRHEVEISSAFIWGDTARKDEGFDYWSIINNKWLYYKEKKGVK